MNDVTNILSHIEKGDVTAAEQLLPIVYDELRKLAAARLAKERPGQTLQATALVHEAYLRLVDVEQAGHWNSRGHFFAAAAEAMRRILVDSTRKKQSLRRGGGFEQCDVSAVEVQAAYPSVDLLALNEAIDKLEQEHPQAASVVKLRYFCGMTIAEVTEALHVSHATVERNWAYARARLNAELCTDD